MLKKTDERLNINTIFISGLKMRAGFALPTIHQNLIVTFYQQLSKTQVIRDHKAVTWFWLASSIPKCILIMIRN